MSLIALMSVAGTFAGTDLRAIDILVSLLCTHKYFPKKRKYFHISKNIYRKVFGAEMETSKEGAFGGDI